MSRPPVSTAGFWERQAAPPYRKQFIVDSPSFLMRLRRVPPQKTPKLHPASSDCSQGQFQCEVGTKAKVSRPPEEARGPAGKGLHGAFIPFFF